MNLLYAYLLLLAGVRDQEPPSLLFANGHVKRSMYACEYEFGEKARDFDDANEALAYRFMPGFSHILRNFHIHAPADIVREHEWEKFEQ